VSRLRHSLPFDLRKRKKESSPRPPSGDTATPRERRKGEEKKTTRHFSTFQQEKGGKKRGAFVSLEWDGERGKKKLSPISSAPLEMKKERGGKSRDRAKSPKRKKREEEKKWPVPLPLLSYFHQPVSKRKKERRSQVLGNPRERGEKEKKTHIFTAFPREKEGSSQRGRPRTGRRGGTGGISSFNFFHKSKMSVRWGKKRGKPVYLGSFSNYLPRQGKRRNIFQPLRPLQRGKKKRGENDIDLHFAPSPVEGGEGVAELRRREELTRLKEGEKREKKVKMRRQPAYLSRHHRLEEKKKKKERARSTRLKNSPAKKGKRGGRKKGCPGAPPTPPLGRKRKKDRAQKNRRGRDGRKKERETPTNELLLSCRKEKKILVEMPEKEKEVKPASSIVYRRARERKEQSTVGKGKRGRGKKKGSHPSTYFSDDVPLGMGGKEGGPPEQSRIDRKKQGKK